MADVEDSGEFGDSEVDDIDLALVAHVDDGDWTLHDLPDVALQDLDALALELRRYDADALALVAVSGDFALLVRADEEEGTRVVLSDITAALEWDLAASVAEHLGVEVDEDEEPSPAGDLGMLADLGLAARELSDLLDDEPDPDELLLLVAEELGFDEELEEELDDDGSAAG